MGKSKYTYEFKKQVVNDYLNNEREVKIALIIVGVVVILSGKLLSLNCKIHYSIDGMYHKKWNRSPHQQIIAFPKAKEQIV